VSSKTKLSPGDLLRLRQLATVDPSKAGPAWRALSEAQTAVLAQRTGGLPYTVVTGPGVTGPEGPPGLCAPKAARVMLDGSLLPVTPDQLDPYGNPEHMKALAVLHGVLIHECGHASHTPEDRPELYEEEDAVVQAVTLLEELRMEAQVIRNRPSDARWLRAASREILLRDPEISGDGAAFSAAVLVEGRVAAGTLRSSDLTEVATLTEEVLGQKTKDEILNLCEEATEIADDDLPGLIGIGRRLADLMPEEMSSGSGRIKAAIAKALDGAAEEALGAGDGELEQLLADKGAREEIIEALAEAARNTCGGAGGASPERGERQATPEERQARNALTLRLREVRWRDRTTVHRSSLLPPGRLRTREALRRSAERQAGKMTTAKPWRQTKRRMVELPKLTCGILLDTSGSMSYAAHELSGSLWAIAHAVHENGGKVAGALFGDTAETVLPVEKPPRHVVQIRPSGGTEHVPEGISLLGELLDWGREDGPRLLIIVSDGYWGQAREAEAAIAEAQAQGIVVLHIGIGSKPVEHGAEGTLCLDRPEDLLAVVGDSAVELLRSW
jgi:hypothetical protein